MNNMICWAVIPEAESANVMKGTCKAVQDVAILLMYKFRPCNTTSGLLSCPTCDMVMDLLGFNLVREYQTQSTFDSGLLEDRVWDGFSHVIFYFDLNMYHNHVTAIPAANHSQQKFFKS